MDGTQIFSQSQCPAITRLLGKPAFIGAIVADPGDPTLLPLVGGSWYKATADGAALEYSLLPGDLQVIKYLTADLLLDGTEGCVLALELFEPEAAEGFSLRFGLINQAGARLRIPLEATQQNRWMLEREGAWLKPIVGGKRVDLAKVNRLRITLLRHGTQPVRWCMTAPACWTTEPPKMESCVLPKGPLVDPLGQSTLHNWANKTRSVDEVVARLREQSSSAINHQWPAEYSRYGGALGKQVEATGFFRTHHDGRRWWLVDPEGFLFWSSGVDCVGLGERANCAGLEPALAWRANADGTFREACRDGYYNFLAVNLIRAFGPQTWRDHWWKIAQSQLRNFGFNTVGNWSHWSLARAAKFPYVRPLQIEFPNTPKVFREFPDVFHPHFAQDAAAGAEQLRETVEDPALIGYFLMNEPTWGFAEETPAAGMLYNAAANCETRKALAEFLRRRHGNDAGLAAAWGLNITYISIAINEFKSPLNEVAREDLEAFSAVMVEKLYKTLSEACKKVDPHHLNLGARYYRVPPEWCLEGMKCFDVFSVNAYQKMIPTEAYEAISEKLNVPVLVGEWHFGAYDAGLPATGICAVATQQDRGRAFSYYLETAAASPVCVGVHYFQMYDQSVLGRFDGENYHIGLVDVCNRPYEALAWAARTSHEKMYKIAAGELAPPASTEMPAYLPPLFY